jgi:hypothetical protein
MGKKDRIKQQKARCADVGGSPIFAEPGDEVGAEDVAGAGANGT